MNKPELKSKVIELSKTLKRNEVYDYIIAKYLVSDRVSKGLISVTDIEEVTGLKIKDVGMMNKLLFYWTNILTGEQMMEKLVNIIAFVDLSYPKGTVVKIHHLSDNNVTMVHINKGLTDESNNAAKWGK